MNTKPRMDLEYSITRCGVSVRGHESRCRALENAWNTLGVPTDENESILVLDITDRDGSKTERKIDRNQFVVEITDINSTVLDQAQAFLGLHY